MAGDPYPGDGAHSVDRNTILSWKSGIVRLEADFDDKPIDVPIGTGGPEVGEPYSVSSSITAIVRDDPLQTPCLEITDIDDYYAGYVKFDFLEDAEVTTGVVAIKATLWFAELDSYSVYVREHIMSAESFTNVYFIPSGGVFYSDKNSSGTPIGSYELGRPYRLILVFDMDSGTYDVWFGGELLLADEPHGVTARGVGQVMFGCTNDGNLDGTLYVDDISVTWDGACHSTYEILLGMTNPPLSHGTSDAPVYDPGELAVGDHWWQIIETNDAGTVVGPVWSFGAECCLGESRGNCNYDPANQIEITDLGFLVDFMFVGGPPPPCFEEADMNCDGSIDISDLVWLVDYMFNQGLPPCRCDCSDCQ